jgi:hypothetical protein
MLQELRPYLFSNRIVKIQFSQFLDRPQRRSVNENCVVKYIYIQRTNCVSKNYTVIFSNTLHYAPEAAAVYSSHSSIKIRIIIILFSVSVSFVIEVIILKSEQMSKLSADELLSCRLTITMSMKIPHCCLFLKP